MGTLSRLDRARPTLKGKLAFFLGFLRHPGRVGALLPSSRFVERRLAAVGEADRARTVVELGPGTGGTTRALLEAMPSDGRLLAIELDDDFVAMLQAQADPRLRVYHGGAEHLGVAIAEHDLGLLDLVVSGIPFSNMPRDRAEQIIRTIWASLAPGGRFVAYQYRGEVARIAEGMLGPPQRQVEYRNLPPVRIYRWTKPSDR